MRITHLAWILCAAATVVGVTGPTARASDVPNRPNILVILLDDAGYADFGFMGSPDLETPAIDRWKTGHADALWREGKDWTEVTYEIHRALMDQREPHYTHPGAMRAYRSRTGDD